MSGDKFDEADRRQSIADERADERERNTTPAVGARVVERDADLSLVGIIRQVDNGIRSTPTDLYVIVDWQEDGYLFAEWRAWGELMLVDP